MNAETIAIAHAAVRMYAESHPRPAQVTQKQASSMLGCGIGKVRDLVRSGTLKLNPCGMIPVTEIDRALSSRSVL